MWGEILKNDKPFLKSLLQGREMKTLEEFRTARYYESQYGITRIEISQRVKGRRRLMPMAFLTEEGKRFLGLK